MSESRYTNIARVFINEVNRENMRETMEMLDDLLTHLMEKDDPEPHEIALVDTLSQYFEKYKLLENNLREYVKNGNQKTLGNVLSDLYGDESHDGFSRNIK